MRTLILALLFLSAATALTAQAPPYIQNGHADMDESCRVQLADSTADKPHTKKNDALCQRTKDKDVYVNQAMMWKGTPRTMTVHIREMSYLFQNPTTEKVRFTFTYHLKPGHRIDPNGGPHPSKETPTEAVYVIDLQPGMGTHVDIADRDK